ncbi:hypothetical protein GX51_07175 [Blastomyces parvus]|uniref:CST complex subunit Stn1 N-terminal domain-containing protein n=1 Tax=Blastomyces parvus TaxID=2060905 RepID=A0A2B7WMJ1_9EURO|nr:hypothetical protein GX51_07175 [Blastomyces parvus]
MADHGHNGPLPLTYYPAFCHKVSPTFFAWVKIAAIDMHHLKLRPGFEGQNIYFYLNHPIQFICAAGIIVARDEQERRSILVLDDSSGACLEVVCSKNVQVPNTNATTTTNNSMNSNNHDSNTSPPEPTHLASATHRPLNITPLLPGARAKLKGTISCFRGVLQLHLERYEILHDTNAEVRFWDERTRFRLQVLSVPWVVARGEVEKLRAEAEGVAVGGAASHKDGDRDLNADGHVVARRRKAERGREREKERARRREEREERDRLRIEKRYEKEEVVREKLARRCREKSALVRRDGKRGKRLRQVDV